MEGLLRYTNNRMLTGYTGGKLLWLRDEEPENFARMKIFCCPKDYIRFRLTGRVLTDVSEASGTGFFDTKNRVWADGLIALAGLDKAIFPKTVGIDRARGLRNGGGRRGNWDCRGTERLCGRRRRGDSDHGHRGWWSRRAGRGHRNQRQCFDGHERLPCEP